MFESMRDQNKSSVVQPVLAVVIHAGLLSLAVGSHHVRNLAVPVGPESVIVYVPLQATGTTDPVSGDGTGDPIPVSDPIPRPPGLSWTTPDSVTVPLHLPGTFDRNRILSSLSRPDSVPVGMGIVTESELTDPPRALHLAEPRYPEALRQAAIEGVVNVTYVVDASGLVEASSIRVVSSDHPAFSEAVIAAIGQARFTPGLIRGRAVRVLVRQTIRFATRASP